MHTIAVYGSLKHKKYNNHMLEGCKMVGIVKVMGTLYQVSSYPALIRSGTNLYNAEVYEVPDDVFERINRMEIGAGYEEVEKEFIINDKEVTATVYYAGVELREYCEENKKVIDDY